MKKEIKLFFDFEFTSLSPDAQPISFGIVSDEKRTDINTDPKILAKVLLGQKQSDFFPEKSFYAEFSDFDINRCDDWVKENVVSKLSYYGSKYVERLNKVWPDLPDADKDCSCITNGFSTFPTYNINPEIFGTTGAIKNYLFDWLKQFSDYDIQFVGDCATYDWYWMVQLLGEWDVKENENGFNGKCPTCHSKGIPDFKTGLPQLPENISPVPMDLNDLIAFKKRISVREAFDLNREDLYYDGKYPHLNLIEFNPKEVEDLDIEFSNKHNALWDAKVIKEIYHKL